MMEKMARKVSENLANQMQDKFTTKYEWHAFECHSKHDFAVKIPVNVSVAHVMEVYSAIRCPICESANLTKQPNL